MNSLPKFPSCRNFKAAAGFGYCVASSVTTRVKTNFGKFLSQNFSLLLNIKVFFLLVICSTCGECMYSRNLSRHNFRKHTERIVMIFAGDKFKIKRVQDHTENIPIKGLENNRKKNQNGEHTSQSQMDRG